MLGQPRQALEDARTSTTLDAAFEKGWTRLARCCVLLGDTVTARQALTRLGELGGDNPGEQRNVEVVERLVADSQQALTASDYRRALYCLDKALELATHSLTMKTSRAECLAFLGRYSEVRPPSYVSWPLANSQRPDTHLTPRRVTRECTHVTC